MIYSIYTLSNPSTGEIFYVGCTKNIRNRMYGHTYKRTRYSCKRTGFINAKDAYVLCLGTDPIVHVIQEVSGSMDMALERERFWISFLLTNGFPLVNSNASPRSINIKVLEKTESIRA